MSDEIEVSVICIVYNHELFLEKCLKNFVNQKVNFKYEVIVHDDASTDSSPEIIRKFADEYPDIIVPIIQKENQRSKGTNIANTILIPKARGKYIAFCEGDDFWCDENKLQKQYDYMEKNKDFSICMHNTWRHDLTEQNEDILFNNWKEIHEMTPKEVFMEYKVHFSSYFIRKDAAIVPQFAWKYWFGDFVRLTIAYAKGKACVLPDVMSVYNANNVNGMTHNTYKKSNDIRISRVNKIKDYLIEFNEYTNGEYEKIVNERILEIEVMGLLFKYSDVNTYDDFKKCKKELLNYPRYKEYYQSRNFVKKIKMYLKYINYFTFVIVKKIQNRK